MSLTQVLAVTDFWTSKQTLGNQTAMSVENDATIYNSTINFTVNTDGTSQQARYLHMQDGAEIYQSDVHLYGEGQFLYALDLTSAKNQLIYSGQLFIGPQPILWLVL